MAQSKNIIEKSKRMNIHVEEVLEEKQVGRGGAVKLEFRGTAQEEGYTSSFKYASFIKSIFPFIRECSGGIIVCDVEISEHEYDGQMYQDRLLLQAYKDGQPLRQKDSGGGSSGGSGGRTWQPDPPEKIASIEAQTIFNGVTEALVAKVVTLNSDLGEMWQAWAKQGFEISQRFRNAPAPQQPKAEPKTLVETAKEMGAEEITPEEIDWETSEVKTNGVKIDEQALKEAMTEAKWAASTVKSWCKSTIKTDANGQPLNTTLELMPFLKTMNSDSVDKLFKMMESKRQV